MITVQDLPTDLHFASDSQEVEFIKSYFGDRANEFDSFFVATDNGDYSEVYGMYNNVPYDTKQVYKIV